MTGGSLVLVAKFHRNNCYEPVLLTGQFGVLGLTGQSDSIWGCRSGTEEIAVSNVYSTNFLLNANQEAVVWFTFPPSSPVPINATDLYFQVVYRGGFGAESDAVVVSTKDVSEPTFINYKNYSDCEANNGVVGVNNDASAAAFPGTFSPTGTGPIYLVGVNLPPATYSRVAVIADTGNLSGSIDDNNFLDKRSDTSPATIAQVHLDGSTEVLSYNLWYSQSRHVTSPPGSLLWEGMYFGALPLMNGGPYWTESYFEGLCPAISPIPHPVTITFTPP